MLRVGDRFYQMRLFFPVTIGKHIFWPTKYMDFDIQRKKWEHLQNLNRTVLRIVYILNLFKSSCMLYYVKGD